MGSCADLGKRLDSGCACTGVLIPMAIVIASESLKLAKSSCATVDDAISLLADGRSLLNAIRLINNNTPVIPIHAKRLLALRRHSFWDTLQFEENCFCAVLISI